MKHLDKLLLKSFLGPFIVTFGIAWFVLLMQFLWFFLEKIAGKGLSFGLVMELIAYRSVGLLPLATPLAALIASVMVIGGLAERFELSALQSAGASFRRLLQPLVFVGMLLCVFSWLTADYLIPAANFKFLYRLADVQRKKPALNLEPGVFNEELTPFTFYAASRASDGKTLTDILLYNRQDANGALNQITAQTGVFTSVPATKELLFTLSNGVHYQQQYGGAEAPLVRTEFRSYQMVFDLSKFDLVRSARSEETSNHYAFLTTWQLQDAADSVNHLMQVEGTSFAQETEIAPHASRQVTDPDKKVVPSIHKIGKSSVMLPRSFATLPQAHRKRLVSSARAVVREITKRTLSTLNRQKLQRAARSRFLFEKHAKLALAVSCILFVIIGGATGAIVRRGGFGYPLLVSTASFVCYVLVLEFCKRLMKTETLTGPAAGWIPAICLIAVGGFLLRRAATAI